MGFLRELGRKLDELPDRHVQVLQVATIVAAALLGLILVIVSSGRLSPRQQEEEESISLRVTTTFTAEDGNSQNYQEALEAFKKESGYNITDLSSLSDETFKTRILQDFETGSEPDVLFFFTGADANSFIRAGKVVDLEEIRFQDGYARDRKKGSHRMERIPKGLNRVVSFHTIDDYAQLLPDPSLLPSPFTSADYRKAWKTTERNASIALLMLTQFGILERTGKKGNAYLYEIAKPYRIK